jgi:MoxR-like ATPase
MSKAVTEVVEHTRRELAKTIVGQRDAMDLLLVTLLCGGHALIEGVPGLAKTLAVRTIARILRLDFHRVQCTPDLMPADIIGSSILNMASSQFTFRRGPLFTDLLLVDEINRMPPRTQSALLEAMEERQVTAEGETRPLPRPFLVLATQNPIELEGTFPLPEAQLDRFLLRVRLGYPSQDEAKAIARRFEEHDPFTELRPVMGAEEVLRLAREVRRVHLSEPVLEYLVRVVQATRAHPDSELGASPRATLALSRTARALAALRGRAYVLPDDVKALAPAVLAHRLILSSVTQLHGGGAEAIVAACLESVPVPVESE